MACGVREREKALTNTISSVVDNTTDTRAKDFVGLTAVSK